MRHPRLFVSALLILMLLAMPFPAEAQEAPITADELETFLNGFFAEQMDKLRIPGIVVIFVQDGDVLLSKGYGFADVEARVPMDPEETIVRIGSVSKLFVATAVMQLVEQGRLDLHADVNEYLTTFRIDDNTPQPVTLAHLLTHTGGFDYPLYSTTTDPDEVPPLGSYLAEHMPPRVIPTGEIMAYSNHGYALAAYIVEEVCGQPFHQYVAQHILRPLAMDRSGYLLSSPLPDGLATGYVTEQGEYLRQPVDYDADYPGGSMATTAADMARFMLAHLGGGCHGEVCILQPATVTQMRQQQVTNHPQLPGWTYGFSEGFQNGQRLIGRSGAILGFGGILQLLPEHNLGYFVSFNHECIGSEAGQIIGALRQQFFDLTGDYRDVWYPHSTVHKISVLGRDVAVSAGEQGIVVDGREYKFPGWGAPAPCDHPQMLEILCF
ncbi:MAG: beta-lactamase family protein [Anaerolineales bacterium]|nr:beta-lactamase family protein [Anaerolineales bacterium]